jgi:hypothetical protein
MLFKLILSTFLFSSFVFADVDESVKAAFPRTVQQFLDWEFNANTANDPSSRGQQYFKMEHYEIPLEKLETHFSSSWDPKIEASMIFERDGKEWIRWVINPEDTQMHLQVKNWLDNLGIDSTPKTHFYGALTSSRSMIIIDPEIKTSFSIKVGTNKTGGNWQDKGVNRNQVVKARLASDIQEQVESQFTFKTLGIQKETAGAVIDEIDHGFIIRELGDDFVAGEKYYLPGFSALHEDVGQNLAKLNNATNPADFWNLHYHTPLGRASGEMYAFMGLTFSSAHSQQYLIELDSNMKPTGQIIFRDVADSWAFDAFFERFEETFADSRKIWLTKYMSNSVEIATGTLHGMNAPSWINSTTYAQMNQSFFDGFDQAVHEVTRVPLEDLKHGSHQAASGFSYARRTISNVNTEGWQNYLDYAACFQGKTSLPDGRLCKEVLSYLKNNYFIDFSKCANVYLGVL